jgi:hypothetical protein
VNVTDKIAARLTLLEGVNISHADREMIVSEIEENERIIAELEEFAGETPWLSLHIQPPGNKA